MCPTTEQEDEMKTEINIRIEQMWNVCATMDKNDTVLRIGHLATQNERATEATVEAIVSTISKALRQCANLNEDSANKIKQIEIHCDSREEQARTARLLQLLTGKWNNQRTLGSKQNIISMLNREHKRKTKMEDEEFEAKDEQNKDTEPDINQKPNRVSSKARINIQTTTCPICKQEWKDKTCTNCNSINEKAITEEDEIIWQTEAGEIQILETTLPKITDELENEINTNEWKQERNRKHMWMPKNGCECQYVFTGAEMMPTKLGPLMMEHIKEVNKRVKRYGITLDTTHNNEYDGKDNCIPWHSDNERVFKTE